FNAPHVPRETAQKYYDLYPHNQITLQPSFKDNMPLNQEVVYQYAPNPLRKNTMQKRVQQNNAMVSHIDMQLGNIIKALKDKGIYDDTIIVFTSDHGINFGENGVAGKVCLYEPSVTAPLIVKAPNMKSNRVINSRVYLQDIVPTLYELLDFEWDGNSDFRSLKPLLEGKKQEVQSIYLAMFDDQRGIVSNNDKLIYYPKTGHLELYNLKKDPWETTNIAQKKTSKAVIKKLLFELKLWQEKTKDETDLSPVYKNFKII
ncbi:MAG: sulfatase-like hydrolase/transferase, partial [Bacteroidetes bacterium]|nr:sulfatase-like hydrolase/transferase [Bacteroidota bacterium]